MFQSKRPDEKSSLQTRLKNFLWECLGWFDWVVFLNQLIAVVIIFFLSYVFFSVQMERQFQKLEPNMARLAALVSTSTEEEYAEIAEELRHSLILRTLKEKDQVYIDLIPRLSKNLPGKGFGGKDSVKGNRQGFLSRAGKSLFETFYGVSKSEPACRKSPFGLFRQAEDQVYIDLIPNTAEACPLDGEYGPNFGPIYMASLNTGALYDLTSQSQTPTGEGAADIRFGYDEVSGSQIMLCRTSDGASEVNLHREEGVVSIHRMKRHFCESCIKSMVEALTNQSVLEYVIYDAETGAIYPISEGAEYEIGNYTVTVTRESGDRRNDYQIAIEPQ